MARKNPPKPAPRRLALEELEKRILFSADVTAFMPIAPQPDDLNTHVLRVQPSDPAHNDTARANEQVSRELVFAHAGAAGLPSVIDRVQNNELVPTEVDLMLLDGQRDPWAQISETLRGESEVAGLHIVPQLEAEIGFDVQSLMANADAVSSWCECLTTDAMLTIHADLTTLADGPDVMQTLQILTNDRVAPTQASASTFEVVFVDAGTPNADVLINDLLVQQTDSRHFEIVLLDAGRDGVEQITEALRDFSGVDAVHIISHGSAGTVFLGNTELNASTINDYRQDLQSWSAYLDEGADLLFYGCDLAATDSGEQLIDAIAQLTLADVAASDDLTGHIRFGGDWELEFQRGIVETETAFTRATQLSWDGVLATVVVDTDQDIQDAPDLTSIAALQADPGTDGSISLREAIIAANNTTGQDSIHFSIGSGLQTINVNASGLPIITDSVILDARTQPGWSGTPLIQLDGSATPTGAGVNGLYLRANDSLIAGFIVHSFGDEGIEVDGFTGAGDNNTIQNNWIGIDNTGADRGNAEYGLMVTDDADGNLIGGSGANDGNIISGNNFAGLVVRTDSNDNIVQGNMIGVGPDGVTPIGNDSHGIEIHSNANNNLFGGTTPEEANVIANNAGDGISILTGDSTGNALLGNEIYANAGLGIDLMNDGVTGNDLGAPPDQDGGANRQQNAPVLSGAISDNEGNVTIRGTLASTPSTTFRLEFFASQNEDASSAPSHGEAERYLGFMTVTTDVNGFVNFDAVLSATLGANEFVTATATEDLGGSYGNSSEFAENILSQAHPIATDDTASTDQNSVLNVAAPGVLTNDTDADPPILLSPTGGHTLDFNAGIETNTVNNIWENEDAATTHDWTLNGWSIETLYTSSPASSLPGITGAYQFTGSGSGATADTYRNLAGNPVDADASFELWFRPDTLTGPQMLFETGGNASTGMALHLTGSVLNFDVQDGAQAAQVSVDLNSLGLGDPTAEFIQVVGVIDLAGDQIELFVNGASVGTAAFLGSEWGHANDSGLGAVNGQAVAGSGALDGDVAIFRFYEQALNASEVINNFESVAGAPLVVTEVNGQAADVGNQITLASGALLTLNADGSYAYDPNGQFDWVGAGDSTIDSFNYTVVDGDGLADTGIVSITVNGLNESPSVDLDADDSGVTPEGDFTTAFETGGGPVTITDADATVTDIDVANLASMTVTITNLLDEANEVLAVDTSGTGISASYVGGVLTLTGSETRANYEQVLRTLTYDNLAATPDETMRTISVVVNDGYADSPAVNAYVAMNASEHTSLWLSTDSDVGAPGADGLPGGWNQGEVLEVGGPTLRLGSNTDGDLASIIDFDSFSLDATDVGGLHYVSRDMTVGGGANTFDLQGGDVLVSFHQAETILAAYTDSALDETYDPNDILVFRPTTPGDYSDGTFYLLFDDLVASPERVMGFTLVEQDTSVGGTALTAGSLLFTRDANGPESIYAYATTGVGQGTTSGTVTTLVDGNDISLGAGGGPPRGLELIERATTIGGVTLAEGTILATINANDTYVGDNGVEVLRQDIVALHVTSTGVGTTAASAAAFFEGTDINLDHNPSAENLYAIALVNQAPTFTSPPSANVPEGTTSVVMLAGSDPVGQPVSFNIIGGADQARFQLTAGNQLEFLAEPDFEAPSDADTDNVYEVILEVSDGNGGTDTQTFLATVTNVNEAPATDDVSASGPEDAASIAVTLTASDVDSPVDSFQLSNLPANGTLYTDAALTTLAATGIDYAATGETLTLYFVPNADWNGLTNFQYAAKDDLALADATPATATITVTAVNDAPALDLDADDSSVYAGGAFSTTFVTGVGPVSISDTDATVVDIDTATLGSMTVTITNLLDGANEILAVDTSGTSIGASYAGGVLTLLGNDTAANYQQVLRTLTYENLAGNPDATSRRIEIVTNDGTADSVLVNAYVAINPTVSTDLWVSTDTDVAAPGADGLPGGWRQGEVLDFGGPTLALGSNTDGDLSRRIDFDTFTTDPADPGGIHYVSADITIGSGANTFDLQGGDLLVTFHQAETFLGAFTDSGLDETYGPNDILVFRPTTPGDYSNGTFYLVLDDVVPNPERVMGFTFVQQDTMVGGTNVTAGSFLFTRDLVAPEDVHWFVPTDVGQGTTVGTISTLIDGSDIGIDSATVRGLELIEQATTVGGVTLVEGTLLVTTDASDTVGDNNILVERHDIMALTVTSTGVGTTSADASLFLDGSDVNLDDNPGMERLWAIALFNESPLFTSSASASVPEGTTPVATLTAIDPTTDEMTFRISGGDDQGRFQLTGGNQLEFLAAPDFETPTDANNDNVYEVIVEVSDGHGGTDTQLFLVTVTNVNEAPTTDDVSASGAEDATSIAVTLTGSDIDGTVDQFTLSNLPANGTLYTDAALTTLATIGVDYAATSEALTLYFVPNSNWNGSTNFQYAAKDDVGLADATPGTASITVTAVNDEPVTDGVNASGAEDATSIAVTLTGSDIDGTVDQFTLSNLPANATLYTDAALTTLAATGVDYAAAGETLTLYFIPDSNWNGSTNFQYAAKDDVGLADATPGTASITVTAVNDEPVTDGVNASGAEDAASIAITLTGADIDGTVDQFTLSNLPANGTLYTDAALTTLAATGVDYAAAGETLTLYFVPNSNWNGSTNFQYAAKDDVGLADATPGTASITVTAVNDEPVTDGVNASGAEDATSIAVTLTGSDIDGTVDQFTLSNLPANATLYTDAALTTLAATGVDYAATSEALTLYFVPNSNWNGSTDFQYAAKDNTGLADATPGTAGITVSAVNDAPMADDVSATGIENATSIAITLMGIDIDGTVDHFALSNLPANGMLYTDAELTTLAVTGVDYAATGESLTLYFVPNADWNGSTDFQFAAKDDLGLAGATPGTATLTVTSVNDAPTTDDVSTSGVEDAASIAVTLTGSDIDGYVDHFRLSNLPANGMLYTDAGLTTLAVTGVDYAATGEALTLYFVPDSNWNGSTNFHYAAKDNNSLADATPGTSSITVTSDNDEPVTDDVSATGVEDAASIAITLTGADIDGAVDQFTLNNLPANGTLYTEAALTSLATTGVDYAATGEALTLYFVPDSNWNGSTNFQYAAKDNNGLADISPGTATITVTSVNNAPETDDVDATGAEDATFIAITLTGADVDGTVDQFTLSNLPANGTLYADAALTTLATTGVDYAASGEALTLYFVPNSNWNGSTSIQYAAKDNANLADATPGTATITVTSVNDAPVINSDGGEDSATIGVLETTHLATTITALDAEGESVTFTVTGGVDAGRFMVDATTGALRFTTAPDFEAPDDADGDGIYQVEISAIDASGATDTQTLNVAVANINESPVIADQGFTVGPSGDGRLGIVNAIDPDSGDTIAFEVTGGSGAPFLSVDPATGLISVASPLLYERQPGHSLTLELRVTDSLGESSTATVTVLVEGIADQNLPVVDEQVAVPETRPLPQGGADEGSQSNAATNEQSGASEPELEESSESTEAATEPAPESTAPPNIAFEPDAPQLTPTVQSFDTRGYRYVLDVLFEPQGKSDGFQLAQASASFEAMSFKLDISERLREDLGESGLRYLEDTVPLLMGSTALSLAFSAGFVTWVLRAGMLFSSLLTAAPTLRQLDPLPIFGNTEDEDDDATTDPTADPTPHADDLFDGKPHR